MMKYSLRILCLLVASACGALAFEPVNSYVVVDHYTGKILGQKNATEKVPVASLTKVAMGCVVLDWAKATQTNLAQAMVVPTHASSIGGANPLGLQGGDQLSIRDGLYASLMSSDNVAAETLAYHVGVDLLRRRGKQGDPLTEFIREMNALAGKLAMNSTLFVNAHGLDDNVRRRPYSTASDLARLSRYAMDKPDFRFYVSQNSRKVAVNRYGEKRSFGLKNTNDLVGKSRIDGVKTGQTTYSGPCVIASATKSNQITKLADGRSRVQPRRLTVVVLAAQDRFRSAQQLLDWGWNEYDGWNRAGRPMNDRNGAL